MVAVPALALNSAHMPKACAQVQISCPADLSFNRFFVCGTGSLEAKASGGTNKNGCIVVKNAATAAQCIVRNGGIPVTKSVSVQFTINSINITNAGSNARVDGFEMLEINGTTATSKLTLSATSVNNTVTINVGATLNFNENQSTGSYIGSINISAN